MSQEAQRWAMRTRCPWVWRGIYLTIAGRADTTGACTRTIQELCFELVIPERTLRAILAHLESLGALQRTGGRGRGLHRAIQLPLEADPLELGTRLAHAQGVYGRRDTKAAGARQFSSDTKAAGACRFSQQKAAGARQFSEEKKRRDKAAGTRRFSEENRQAPAAFQSSQPEDRTRAHADARSGSTPGNLSLVNRDDRDLLTQVPGGSADAEVLKPGTNVPPLDDDLPPPTKVPGPRAAAEDDDLPPHPKKTAPPNSVSLTWKALEDQAVPFNMTGQDKKAVAEFFRNQKADRPISEGGVSPLHVAIKLAAAYAEAARHEWGNQWLWDNLALHLVISRWGAYETRSNPTPARRNGGYARPETRDEIRARMADQPTPFDHLYPPESTPPPTAF